MQDTLPPTDPTADCTAIRAHVDDVVAQEADAVTVARVEAHAARCAACRHVMAAARAYRRAMRRVGASERAPATLRERAITLMHETRDPRGPRP
ncbi:zf-HC2 domain-containing protein [Pseudogemmatithrix spongiicola]|uniref:Zf-HC2 domain-containing protein n=1 Tax=Pseudogemmatithrix spongiicola TaxID=3062599 RepID=A0AA49Q8D4_9BACT|nr:zf-HC2 domain-containing protein [Gemmatimonadaceae bacterium 'strain 138']WKW15987.1 zf-HC2 domain-containing protein [Gemmatimonadaceae bacterium 'strain 318']